MKDLSYYRQQPYERVLEFRFEGDERYLLYRLREIPAIAGDGVTKDEALANLRDAFDDYITWALEEGLRIPEPARGLMRTPRQKQSTPVTRQTLPGASVTDLTSEVTTAGPETRLEMARVA